MSEANNYRRVPTAKQVEIANRPVNALDQHLIDQGHDPVVLNGLRERRDQNYANPIEGAVHSGSLSKCVLMAYAPPSLTTVPVSTLITVYVVQFYETIGATLGLLAFFQALARAFDVITDPTMSYLTDSWRSKHGRRRPFLFTGAPIYCLCLICLLLPHPELGSFGVSAWFGVFYLSFFLFSTYCNIPYDALAPELTDNPKDRDLLFFTCTLFDGFGGLCAALFPIILRGIVDIYRSNVVDYQYLSCDNPFYDASGVGHINATSARGPWPTSSTGRSSPPISVVNWNNLGGTTVNVSAAEVATWNVANCSDTSGIAQYANQSLSEINWCECHAKADVTYSLDSLRYSYFFTGLFFGLWALISLWICVFFVKERGQMDGAKPLEKPSPIIPTILSTFANRPFTLLLPAWVLDNFATTIITSLLTFFVRYVVKPEYSNQELYGCRPFGGSNHIFCSTTNVLGMSVLALLLGALLFLPFWLIVSKKLGKRNTWLLWSFANGATFLVYAFVGEGDVILCIVMSVINGAPIGAKFLGDSIMADVIDYDEFLTGTRSEATYTMFKGFLPKIAAIPASAIPLVLLASFGHKKPIDGVIQIQPASIKMYIQVVIIYVPSIAAFSAFLIKLRFPMRTQRDNECITEGVSKHILGLEAVDPCSGKMFIPIEFTSDDEIETKNLLDAFPGLNVINRMVEDPVKGVQDIKKHAVLMICGSVVWLITFFAISIGTFKYLMSTDPLDEQLQVVPVLSIVFFGIGITMTAFSILCNMSAAKLMDHKLDIETLKKIQQSRKDLAGLQVFPASIRGGYVFIVGAACMCSNFVCVCVFFYPS